MPGAMADSTHPAAASPAAPATQADWARREWFEAQAAQDSSDAASYFAHAANGYQRFRHAELLEALQRTGAAFGRDAMLDVGCAAGDLTALLAERLGFREATGIDFVPAVVEQAKARFPGLSFRTGALPAIDLADASFDLVVASEVLYYLTEPARLEAMAEIARVLRPGGVLLFTAALGPTYFSPQSARELVGSQLEIIDERLLHMGAYHAVTWPLQMAARIHPMLGGAGRPASETAQARFERWYPYLRPVPVRAALGLAASAGRPVLRSRRLPAIMSRLPLPGRRATNIVIVAQRAATAV